VAEVAEVVVAPVGVGAEAAPAPAEGPHVQL